MYLFCSRLKSLLAHAPHTWSRRWQAQGRLGCWGHLPVGVAAGGAALLQKGVGSA